MMKPAVVAATLALLTSAAAAEIQTRKAPVRQSRVAAVEATADAMNAALTVDDMVDKINKSYMPGLRRCYTKALKQDPTLKGKVTLTFSISSFGNVSGEADGISRQVDACVETQLKRWNFGRPTDRREANYRISLVLAQ